MKKKNKQDKQNKCRDFAKILCFVYIVFIFQRESAKSMQTIEKKTVIEFVNDVNVLIYNTSTEKKLQNFQKVTRNFYDVISML